MSPFGRRRPRDFLGGNGLSSSTTGVKKNAFSLKTLTKSAARCTSPFRINFTESSKANATRLPSDEKEIITVSSLHSITFAMLFHGKLSRITNARSATTTRWSEPKLSSVSATIRGSQELSASAHRRTNRTRRTRRIPPSSKCRFSSNGAF